MKFKAGYYLAILFGLHVSCGSPSNQRGVTIDELEKVQHDAGSEAGPGPSKDALTAKELIALADCRDLPCVQLYMKDHSEDFIHAKKGEFAALHRSVVVDTGGRELIMPLSTLYVDVNPQASWRIAHTLHRKEMGENLLNEFKQLGFALKDSGFYRGLRYRQWRYISDSYPGISVFLGTTFSPWNLKGLYRDVSWPCVVFEVYREW